MKKLYKKLIPFTIILGLSLSLLGQSQPEAKIHSLSVVVGPNWEKAIRFGLLDDDILIRTGYSLGLDYFQTLTPRWQAKISVRYHRLNFAEISYIPQFDTFGTVLVLRSETDKITQIKQQALSISAGIRRFGQPSKFRWFWAGEAGATVFTTNTRLPAATLGLGTGWEWTSPQKDWAISAQPIFRVMFWGSQDAYSDHVVLALELGVRRIFGKKTNL